MLLPVASSGAPSSLIRIVTPTSSFPATFMRSTCIPPISMPFISTRNPSITAAGQMAMACHGGHLLSNSPMTHHDHPLWWPKKISAADLSCFPWPKDAGITFQWKVLIQMFQTRPVHHCLILFDDLRITMVYHHPQWSTNSTPTKTIKRPALDPTETHKLMWR